MRKIMRKMMSKTSRLRYRFWTLILSLSRPKASLDQLNRTQELFCQWNAERLGISIEQSRNRFLRSWNAIPAGHSGPEFLFFCDLSYELFNVFFNDNTQDVFHTYIFHSHAHFLRMLSYKEPEWRPDHAIIRGLANHTAVTILDFGCGLAQRSRSLADYLQTQGKSVHLFLADIPTIRKPFLLWVGERTGIPVTFLDCTVDTPLPDLSPCHVCIAMEVFEHLHQPILYLRKINEALLPGGFLLANVTDHKPEFLHVSTSLAPLREELEKLNYEEVEHHLLFRKVISTTAGR